MAPLTALERLNLEMNAHTGGAWREWAAAHDAELNAWESQAKAQIHEHANFVSRSNGQAFRRVRIEIFARWYPSQRTDPDFWAITRAKLARAVNRPNPLYNHLTGATK